ncbi:MAG: RDD family protein [Polyangiaceae bacterium]
MSAKQASDCTSGPAQDPETSARANTDVDADADADEQPYLASKTKRVLNGCIDVTLYELLRYGLALLADVDYLTWEATDPDGMLWVVLCFLAYYTFFEALFQKTPAKWITKTRVVTVQCKAPAPGRILHRSLVRLVPFDWLSFLMGDGRGWHDRWSRTCVVDDD